MWISNPAAYGVIDYFPRNNKNCGGISNVNGVVKGYFCGDLVYEGDNEKEAMGAVEKVWDAMPDGVKRKLTT